MTRRLRLTSSLLLAAILFSMSGFKRVTFAAAALLATLSAGPAVAQSAPEIPEIQFTQWKLANGLTVIAVPDPTTINVTISMWYKVGAKNDPHGRSGFAHLFEHILNRKTEFVEDLRKIRPNLVVIPVAELDLSKATPGGQR